MPQINLSSLESLAAEIAGTVVLPRDDDWDAARRPWNTTVDQRPAAVVTPGGVEDIPIILAAARDAGLGVAVQPRGHGASGDLSDSILIRPYAFDEITVHPEEQYARVGSGVLWGALLPHLEGTGLVPLSGTNPDVSVVGYLLSGGHSWFSRWQGLAGHSIRAVELVDAQGEPRRVTPDSDPELLWALRGAGGLFGIVTSVEIDLFPASALFGGKILFAGAAAEAVFENVAALMRTAPPELSIFFGLVNFPDRPFVPEPMRGQTFATADVVFVGEADAAKPLLAPLLAAAPVVLDQTRVFTISQIGDVAAEPAEPSQALDFGATITTLDDGGLLDLVGAFRDATPDGLTVMQLRALGGAVADASRDATGVIGHLDAHYLVFAAALEMSPGTLDRALFAPLQKVLDGRTVPLTVPTFLRSGQTLADAYPNQTVRRLAAVKARVDPDNLIRSNRPLR
ncbi:FAD-binding oxidoreductase [Glaciibacter sp. 2TAF33]|uniref:FAD-binding oxidoreductase n=1 Tax=Glaciibacter sp. 2TAF33 TaxID=3233015 RepID=UPI003F8DA2A8